MHTPTIKEAYDMGAKGGPADEHERQLFESWMAGHCWRVDGRWNGTTYVGENEDKHYFDPNVMATRQLWAAWRDRAALSKLSND